MSPGPGPILLVGADRSGTTLLNVMLDAHSAVSMPYESKFFVRLWKRRDELDFSTRAGREAVVRSILAEPAVRAWDPPVAFESIELERCRDVSSTIDAVYRAHLARCGKTRWGDKTPSYLLHLDTLNAMFPDASFVHIVRDGRDVALSIMSQWWGPNDFASALRWWRERVFAARKMLAMLPPHRRYEVRFEDLVRDPETVLRALTRFLGLPFEPAMVDGYRGGAKERVGALVESIHPHLTSRPDAGQALKWTRTLSKADQALAHSIAGDLLAELGYPPGTTTHPLKLWREVYHRLHGAFVWRLGRRRPP